MLPARYNLVSPDGTQIQFTQEKFIFRRPKKNP
jgi:hypothetical protein